MQLFLNKYFLLMGNFILEGFHGHPQMELVFVMVVVPVTLNSLQYWVQDNFLKGNIEKHQTDSPDRRTKVDNDA